MGTIGTWRPSWWTEDVHGSAWDRVKEAMQRDWMQTKHDLHIGGHELNQSATNTVDQAMAAEHLPTLNQANPPKVIGEWDEAEVPYGYGFAAQKEFGTAHPQWTLELEAKLKNEWLSARDQARNDWNAVKTHVRHGYEYANKNKP